MVQTFMVPFCEPVFNTSLYLNLEAVDSVTEIGLDGTLASNDTATMTGIF